MKKPVGLEKNEISIADAQARIERYANTMTALVDMFNAKYEDQPLPTNFVKAFWIPKEDLDGLYNLMQDLQKLQSEREVNGFRTYLGMDENNKMTMTINTTEAAVDDNGKKYNKDIIIEGLLAESVKTVTMDETTSGIYDFVLPCPENCDCNSVLMEPYDPADCED